MSAAPPARAVRASVLRKTAAARVAVSLPAPPSITSLPPAAPLLMMSSPSPPFKVSPPAPPLIVSLPAPPLTMSLPAPVVIWSSRLVPVTSNRSIPVKLTFSSAKSLKKPDDPPPASSAICSPHASISA